MTIQFPGPDGITIVGDIYEDGSGPSLAAYAPNYAGYLGPFGARHERLRAADRRKWMFCGATSVTWRRDSQDRIQSSTDTGRRPYPGRWASALSLDLPRSAVLEALRNRDPRPLLRRPGETLAWWIRHVSRPQCNFVPGPETTAQWREVILGAGFLAPGARLSAVAEELRAAGLRPREHALYRVWQQGKNGAHLLLVAEHCMPVTPPADWTSIVRLPAPTWTTR